MKYCKLTAIAFCLLFSVGNCSEHMDRLNELMNKYFLLHEQKKELSQEMWDLWVEILDFAKDDPETWDKILELIKCQKPR